MHNDVSKEEAKYSALSSGKLVKLEYVTDGEMPPQRYEITEEAAFIYSPLEKKIKAIKDQEKENKCFTVFRSYF